MKKRVLEIMVVLFLLNFVACGIGEAAERVDLSFSIHDPAQSAKTQFYYRLADKAREVSDGRVNITVYPGGTLLAATDVAEGILSGAADIGWLFTTFFPGQFPITEVVTLPFILDNNITGAKVLHDLYRESEAMRNELSKYKVLQLYCNPINHIFSLEPIRTVSDLRGKTLRATAGVPTDMLTLWDANPILQGPGDIYQSIQRGVINAFVFEWSGVDGFNLGEVVNYCTEIPFYVGVFLCVMNLDKWNSLPEDVKAVLEEVWIGPNFQASMEMADIFYADMLHGRNRATQTQNVITITPTAEELATFKPAIDKYIAGWIQRMTTDTFDAQAYVNRVLELAEKHKAD